jgi:hypothetical protein
MSTPGTLQLFPRYPTACTCLSVTRSERRRIAQIRLEDLPEVVLEAESRDPRFIEDTGHPATQGFVRNSISIYCGFFALIPHHLSSCRSNTILHFAFPRPHNLTVLPPHSTPRRHARNNPIPRDHGAPSPPRKGGALPHRRSERLLQDVVRVRFAPGRGPEDKAEGHAGVWQAFARSGAGGAGREDVFVIWYV